MRLKINKIYNTKNGFIKLEDQKNFTTDQTECTEINNKRFTTDNNKIAQ